jgi:hypothetical protein
MSPQNFSLDFLNPNANKERTILSSKKKQLRKTPPSVVCLNGRPFDFDFDFEEHAVNDYVKEYFSFKDWYFIILQDNPLDQIIFNLEKKGTSIKIL